MKPNLGCAFGASLARSLWPIAPLTRYTTFRLMGANRKFAAERETDAFDP